MRIQTDRSVAITMATMLNGLIPFPSTLGVEKGSVCYPYLPLNDDFDR